MRGILMRAWVVLSALTVAAGVALAQQQAQPAQFSQAWYQQFRGPYSAPVEPFRIVGNIHYVGGANIASYLITTSQGHILIDTGMREMHEVIKNGVAKLGFKTSDIRIMLSSHAHFDHVDGHAAMQKLTGAQVMAMVGDAEALQSGRDNSALGAIGWDPVKVARVLKHGDTVSLGGTTPNGGVPLFNNPRHKNVIEDTQRTFARLKAEKVPDIYLVGHPQAMFAGKVERIKAGETPHPLLNGAAWTTQIADAEANFQKRVADERAKRGR